MTKNYKIVYKPQRILDIDLNKHKQKKIYKKTIGFSNFFFFHDNLTFK